MALTSLKASCGSFVTAPRSTVNSRVRSVKARAAADRPTWIPGAPVPEYLTGDLAGDYGFDPLNFGVDSERLKWFVEAEKTNGRWAMMAAVGILGQEILGRGYWWEAGAKDYGFPNNSLLAIEFLVMGFFETKRYQGWVETGTSGFVNSFPFDPAGMNCKDMAIKEVKNGRLAMIAFVGFNVQALVTRKGAVENLFDHITSPFDNNIAANILNLPKVIPYSS